MEDAHHAVVDDLQGNLAPEVDLDPPPEARAARARARGEQERARHVLVEHAVASEPFPFLEREDRRRGLVAFAARDPRGSHEAEIREEALRRAKARSSCLGERLDNRSAEVVAGEESDRHAALDPNTHPEYAGDTAERPDELADACGEQPLVAPAREARHEIDGDDPTLDPHAANGRADRDRAPESFGALALRRAGEERPDEGRNARCGALYGSGLGGVQEPDVTRFRSRVDGNGERDQGERDAERSHAGTVRLTTRGSCHRHTYRQECGRTGSRPGRAARCGSDTTVGVRARRVGTLKARPVAADSLREAVNPPPNTPAAGREDPSRSEVALDPLVKSYRKLADVFHELLSEQSLDDLLHRIADTVGELVPYDDITFYEADEANRELKAVYASGSDAAQVLADPPFPFGVGITGWAVERREPVLANRAELDPRVRFVHDTPADPESLIAVPLVARGKLKGTLNIYRAGFQEFTEEEFLLVVRFGDAAALAIDNAHIRASLERQAQTDPLTGLWNHRTFHERLRTGLTGASAQSSPIALLMLDLDDFKRVNDVYSHAVGDQVLSGVADILLRAVRVGDCVCRIGGEEFAIIAPASGLPDAYRLAERVQEEISHVSFGPVGTVTLSVGIASGPEHAANPRELIACAEVAMMTAKSRGKNEVVVFHEDDGERPPEEVVERRAELRSMAHLKMLHGVSAKLSRLNDVTKIGATIADELRLLIDYHNCRVFVREGDDLRVVSFRGDLISSGSALDVLRTRVGEGITGHVAATGEPFLTGDATNADIGVLIPGTNKIEESLLAVPLLYGSAVVGVIVVSKLGLHQFDQDELRLLEVLAGHASVALVNARLYEQQRRETESAKALLELATELSASTELESVATRIAAGAARIMHARRASMWMPVGGTGLIACSATWQADPTVPYWKAGDVLPEALAHMLAASNGPFLLTREELSQHVEGVVDEAICDVAVVVAFPVASAAGAIAVELDSADPLDERRRELLTGIAAQARLAVTNALSFEGLERTFLATVEALANALEAKDEYTSSHARWIRDLSLRVGEELGLDAAELKRIELGALFHDIAKIGIPASILMKAGPLTADERAVIERHPELGERILAPIEQLADVRPIVRACHERYDGRGYPDGLAGDEIPLEARIIFACDAYHAMTSDRPYRSALQPDEALRRLREASGTQFDPRVVAACLGVFGRGPIAEP